MKAKLLTLTVAAAAFALTVDAAAQQSRVARMRAGGTDGEQAYFTVRCVDRTVATVVVSDGSKQICVTPQGGEPRCSSKWNLVEASERGCQSRAAR